MKTHLGSSAFLLSLSYGASQVSAYADPFPSNIDITRGLGDIQARAPADTSLTMIGAMSKLHKRDTLLSLLKRQYNELNEGVNMLYGRQATTNDPNTGSSGTANMDVAAWDKIVIDACSGPVTNYSKIVTSITDPAGVAVCYNLPYYNASTGAFASDIRLYKITNGTKDWESGNVRMSMSVQYEGAKVQLAQASGTGSNSVSNQAARNGLKPGSGVNPKPSQKETVQGAFKTTSSAKPAATSLAANKNVKRNPQNMAEIFASTNDGTPNFDPILLQTLRFVGQVNSDVMQNNTIKNDPNIMKLVLTPSLMLVGVDLKGESMNASVAAAQVMFVSGAFANITAPPAPPAAPFVLPGTFIAIFPLGLYLFSIYLILFVLIVGWGTVQRYLFRISYRKRYAMMRGKDGFGKI